MSASSASPAASVPEPARHRVGDLGGVERAHQREELAAGTGEPGDRAGRIVRGGIGHGEHGAGGAERDRHIAGPETETEGGAHVVAAARTDADLIGQAQLIRRLTRDRADQIGRAEHQRNPIEPRRAVATDGGPEQAGEHLAGGRIDPTAAAGIATIGDVPARQPPREVVVRQHHVGNSRQHLGFVLGDPRQLGDRERRDGHAARDLRPMLGTQFGHQPFGLRRGRGVVPQLGRPQRGSRRVEQHQPVLLTGDRDRHDVIAMVSELSDRLGQRHPPRHRILLRDRRGGRGVGGMAAGDDDPGVELTCFDLGRLRRRIDAEHERHYFASSMCRATRFSSIS